MADMFYLYGMRQSSAFSVRQMQNSYFRWIHPSGFKASLVVVHTEWCWEMIGYGVYAEVIESCTKLLMLLKEWNMEDSDEYKTTRTFLYMTHQYQSYADTPVLTMEEEALLKKMPGTDMENGFRDKIASVVRFGTDENSKRKMSVIFVDEGNDIGHKAAGGL